MSLRILTFSSLYPNSQNVGLGIFVHTRLKQLLNSYNIEARVVAPVPYFFKLYYQENGAIAKDEVFGGIRTAHPRFINIPKIGSFLAPLLMALSSLPMLRKMQREGHHFQIIDAHYFYPDGVAAALIATWLKIPLIITARGSDINLIAQQAVPRKWISWAAKRSAHIITVSDALRTKMIDIGVNTAKITVLRNGVDTEVFKPPENRAELRQKLGLEGQVLLSVGNLVELKGHALIIEAIESLQNDINLVIVGEGEEEERLKKLVSNRHMGKRVRFLKRMNQNELKDWYGAADLFVLASSREGWPNVLLESLACGTPLVATDVGGSPEVLGNAAVGAICERNVGALRSSITQMLTSLPSRAACFEHAVEHNWEQTSQGQAEIFEHICKVKVTKRSLDEQCSIEQRA